MRIIWTLAPGVTLDEFNETDKQTIIMLIIFSTILIGGSIWGGVWKMKQNEKEQITNEAVTEREKIMSDKKTFFIQIENMDNDAWELLRKQKQELVDLVESGTASDNISGIVHLIDRIQDEAVDKYGMPEEIVFGKAIKD